MALYHYFITKKQGNKETMIDGVWSTKAPIASMDEYREFKRQVTQEKTIEDIKKWSCVSLCRLDT